MRKILVALAVLSVAAVVPVSAHQSSGAIFTTLPDGSAVNFNIYDSKDDVYLDGGPGQQAPQHAAGLDDGFYVFQVTDPSGKVLLSQDEAKCRQIEVVGGVITHVVVNGCEHLTGDDADHGGENGDAITVQLMPYADTPNPGGEYKAWVTWRDDFMDACAANGVADGLEVVDCGLGHRGNFHGFLGRHSKTDNFKVGGEPLEIDVRFYYPGGDFLDGFMATWGDTLGASNNKWSYWDPAHMVFHEAHVENVEVGQHTITLENQDGCTVGAIEVNGKRLPKEGPQTITVNVRKNLDVAFNTIWIDVLCLE